MVQTLEELISNADFTESRSYMTNTVEKNEADDLIEKCLLR